MCNKARAIWIIRHVRVHPTNARTYARTHARACTHVCVSSGDAYAVKIRSSSPLMSDARCHTVLQVLDTRTNVHTRMLECDRNLARGRIGVLSMALHAPE